jgi:hypothetical protein
MLWLMTLLGLAMVSCAAAEVALEPPRARIALGEDASWVSILDRAGDRECLATDAGLAIASVRHEDQWHVASSLAAEQDLLILGFADTDTRLCYRLEPGDDWLVFRLESIEGTRPRMVTLLQAPVAITERVGRRLNTAWDDDTAVCLMAATRQTDCYGRRKQYALLQATSQDVPGPRWRARRGR